MDDTKLDPEDPDSPRRELSNAGLRIVIAHAVCVRSARKEARKERFEAETAFVDELKAAAPRDAAKRHGRVGTNGAWLTVHPDTLGGTLLSRQKFVDNSRIRLNLKVLYLPQHCDGCGAGFSVEHAISFKKGGWVSIRHDDVRNEAGALAELALPKTCVSYEPFIFHGAATRVGGAATPAECSSNAGNDTGKILEKAARKKRAKYEKAIAGIRMVWTASRLKQRGSSTRTETEMQRDHDGQRRQQHNISEDISL